MKKAASTVFGLLFFFSVSGNCSPLRLNQKSSGHEKGFVRNDTNKTRHFPKVELQYVDERALDSALSGIKEVDTLIVYEYEGSRLPPRLFGFTGLKRLEIWGLPTDSVLTELPNELCNLVNLTYLLITGGHFANVPGCLSKLVKLDTLGFIGCGLTDLPNLCTLTRLRTLYLGHNNFYSIPETVYCLSNLTSLELIRNMDIIEVDPRLYGLKHLELLGAPNALFYDRYKLLIEYKMPTVHVH